MLHDPTQAASSTDERINQLTTELQTANKELESLAYAVSHDLRAPLRAIEGFADVVLVDYKDKLDPEGQRFLEIIRTSSLKASKMIEGLLAYSRIGRHEITISEINSTELVQNVLTDLRKVIADRNIDFNIHALPTVRGDFFLLREVWKHLLSNAVKFSRNSPASKIEIHFCEEKGEHRFCISDNGVGFDMKYSEKLFQLFQRLHGESDFEGIGVGLAIAQRVVLRHGGTIWAESKPHQGATFFFTLPK
ncbi:MAG: putative ATPase [Verrucomicrobiales bacterium]|nr:putative ATPase [Verrucomicrobiales bacterium]